MRSRWVAALVVGALGLVVSPVATAATPVRVVAGTLSLSWQDSQQDRIVVGWPDLATGTRLVLQNTAGVAEQEWDATTPDRKLVVDPAEVPVAGVWRFALYDGSVLLAQTAPFDSDAPAATGFRQILPTATSLQISLALAQPADSTPDDPLDTIRVAAEQRTSTCGWVQKVEAIGLPAAGDPPGSGHGIGFAWDGQPAELRLRTINGFGAPRYSTAGRVTTTRLTATMPRTAIWSSSLTFTGSVTDVAIKQTAPTVCAPVAGPSYLHRLWLQARSAPGYDWTTITSGSTDTTGKYTLHATAIGNRQYRVLAPDRNPTPNVLQLAAAGAAVPVTVTTKLLSARFSDATVTSAQRTTASVAVGPANSQRATLQYRRSTTAAWTSLATRTMSAGKASYSFTWVYKGLTYFRWVVPATTYAGLRVEGKTTGSVVLSVR